jgi:integrase
MEKPVEEINREIVRTYFRHLSTTISGHAANKSRKNLCAAWRWGERNIENWPNMPNLFLSIERFKEEKQQRYVPPEEDFWKVYDIAEEQDQIMLLAFFHLGARRNELFGLKWSGVDFTRKQVYLQTRKRDGGLEGDWIPMTKKLSRRLQEWSKKRQSMVGVDQEHVFICLSNTAFCIEYFGQPFQKRPHFMKKICKRAGVKPFGFHSIRHLFASKL